MRRTDEAFRNEVVRRSNKRIIYRRQVRNKIIAACVPLVLFGVIIFGFSGLNGIESKESTAFDSVQENNDNSGVKENEEVINPGDSYDSTDEDYKYGMVLEGNTSEGEDYVVVVNKYEGYKYIDLIVFDSYFYDEVYDFAHSAIEEGELIEYKNYFDDDGLDSGEEVEYYENLDQSNRLDYYIGLTNDAGITEDFFISGNIITYISPDMYKYEIEPEVSEAFIKMIEDKLVEAYGEDY